LGILRGSPQARLAPQDEVRIFRHRAYPKKKPPASSENRRFVEKHATLFRGRATAPMIAACA